MHKLTKKQFLIASAILILIAALFLTVYLTTVEMPNDGEKQICVTITHGDGSNRQIPFATHAKYLRQALDEQGLIEGEESEYGLFIYTVDGETADASLSQWWCITKSGGILTTGVDTTPIFDGDQFELALTTGY